MFFLCADPALPASNLALLLLQVLAQALLRYHCDFLSLFPISDFTVLVRLRDTAECAYARCPNVMPIHSDTTCESARCLHADGFQYHTSNGLRHATHARSRYHKTNSNSSRAHAQNRQVRVDSLVRVVNPPTVYVRARQDERHATLLPAITNLSCAAQLC